MLCSDPMTGASPLPAGAHCRQVHLLYSTAPSVPYPCPPALRSSQPSCIEKLSLPPPAATHLPLPAVPRMMTAPGWACAGTSGPPWTMAADAPALPPLSPNRTPRSLPAPLTGLLQQLGQLARLLPLLPAAGLQTQRAPLHCRAQRPPVAVTHQTQRVARLRSPLPQLASAPRLLVQPTAAPPPHTQTAVVPRLLLQLKGRALVAGCWRGAPAGRWLSPRPVVLQAAGPRTQSTQRWRVEGWGAAGRGPGLPWAQRWRGREAAPRLPPAPPASCARRPPGTAPAAAAAGPGCTTPAPQTQTLPRPAPRCWPRPAAAPRLAAAPRGWAACWPAPVAGSPARLRRRHRGGAVPAAPPQCRPRRRAARCWRCCRGTPRRRGWQKRCCHCQGWHPRGGPPRARPPPRGSTAWATRQTACPGCRRRGGGCASWRCCVLPWPPGWRHL